jgi:dTDP-4-amino-4,6-dideoxygalactose transaminase
VTSSLLPLAIDGGRPVRETMLRYGQQSLTDEDVAAVVEVLRSDWITTGPKVHEFEEAFATAVGARHAVAFSSGTAALHGAVFAAGLGSGDEAITTPLTFCATANCLLYQGATPLFADVRADTLNLDPAEVERHLTPRTKAVLPVDFGGHPADLDALLSLAARHNLTVIEDASHALGRDARSARSRI